MTKETKRVRRVKRKEETKVKGIPRKFDGRGRINLPSELLVLAFGDDFQDGEFFIYATEDDGIIITQNESM